MTARVVFLDRASLKAKVRKPAFASEYIEHEKTAVDEIVPRLAGATVAIINKVPMRADTLRQLPDLKMIAVAATGYDVVDVAYCKEHGIAVANIRNYAVHTVPEHAFAMIFPQMRNDLSIAMGAKDVPPRFELGFSMLGADFSRKECSLCHTGGQLDPDHWGTLLFHRAISRRRSTKRSSETLS